MSNSGKIIQWVGKKVAWNEWKGTEDRRTFGADGKGEVWYAKFVIFIMSSIAILFVLYTYICFSRFLNCLKSICILVFVFLYIFVRVIL